MNIFIKTLFQGTSPFNGPVKVIETFGVRKLIASGYVQSRSLNKDGKTGSYWDGFVQNLPVIESDGRILMLGLAGGTGIKLLNQHYKKIPIDVVEIDPMMVEIAQKYFDLNEKNVNIIVEDAIKFVKDARYKYDIICVDLFSNGDVAVGAESAKFFENLRNLVKDKGIIVINKLYTTNQEIKDYVDFLHTIFGKTETLFFKETMRTDNVIIFARK